MTTATRKTRKINGYSFSLKAGNTYLATRPMAERFTLSFDVSIQDITDGYSFNARPVRVIRGLDYDAANALINAFNHGSYGFEGREWA